MTQFLFQKENDVTKDWLFYIENEARSLAQRDEFAINNYADREIFNPEMKKFLSTPYVIEMLEKSREQEYEPLFLNQNESYEIHVVEQFMKPRFMKLKTFTKQIFQETVAELENRQTSEIIKQTLFAFMPVFPNGFPTAILPLIITYSAFMIKYGVKMSYPALHY